MSFSTLSLLPKLLALAALAVVICMTNTCGTGQNPPKTLMGIFLRPGSTSAYANSNQSQVVYSVVAGYVGAADVPLTTGVECQVIGSWVSFDPAVTTANCERPAPYDTFLYPTPASIKATVTVEGKTFSDTALLYCL